MLNVFKFMPTASEWRKHTRDGNQKERWENASAKNLIDRSKYTNKNRITNKKKYELQAINHQHNLLTSFDGGDGGDSGDGVKGKALRAKYVRTVPIQHD